MTHLERIEKEISELTRAELKSLRTWFENFDAAVWDAELARDAAAGALDDLADKTLADHRTGHTKAL